MNCSRNAVNLIVSKRFCFPVSRFFLNFLARICRALGFMYHMDEELDEVSTNSSLHIGSDNSDLPPMSEDNTQHTDYSDLPALSDDNSQVENSTILLNLVISELQTFGLFSPKHL